MREAREGACQAANNVAIFHRGTGSTRCSKIEAVPEYRPASFRGRVKNVAKETHVEARASI